MYKSKSYKKLFRNCFAAILAFSMFMSMFLFGPDVKAELYGGKYYYLAIEKQNIQNALKDADKSGLFNTLLEYSFSGKLNFNLTGDYVNSDEDLKKLAEFFSKTEFHFSQSLNNRKSDDIYSTCSFYATYNGNKLGGVNAKCANSNYLIEFPELTDKAIGIKNMKVPKYDNKEIQKIFGKLAEKYIKDIAFKKIPNENVTYLGDVQYKNIKCNAITFNINNKILSDILNAISKELRTDGDFKTLFTYYINTAMATLPQEYKTTEDQIDEQIESMCDDLEDQAAELVEVNAQEDRFKEDSHDINFTYTVYFTDNGDILYRQIKDKSSDTSLTLEKQTDLSGAKHLIFNVEEKGKNLFGFNIEKRLMEGQNYCNFKLNIQEKPFIEVISTNEPNAKVGNVNAFVGELRAKINLEQFAGSDLLGMDSDIKDSDIKDSDMKNVYFVLISNRQSSDTLKANAKLFTTIDGKGFEANISTEIKQSDSANIVKPEISLDKAIDIYDMQGIMGIMQDITNSLRTKLPGVFPEIKPDVDEEYIY